MRLGSFLLACALLLAAQFFLAGDKSADSLWTVLEWLGVIALTGLSLLSILGAGQALARQLQVPAVHAAALGTALFAVSAALLAQLGWIGSPVIFLAGISVAGAIGWKTLPKPEWRLLLPILALLPLALQLQTHPDPLYYHLQGIRTWYESRGLHFDPRQPLLFFSGSWDFLYLWPLQWTQPPPGGQLLSQQLAAQVLHLSLGVGGSLYLLHQYLHKKSLPAPMAAAVLILGLPFFLDSAVTAKNDWGLLLWALSALCLWETHALTAGALLGLAISVKWTATLSLLPLLALVAIYGKARARFFGAALVTAGIAIFRDWQATGDPFFPVLSAQPGSVLGSVDQFLFRAFAEAKTQHTAATLLENLVSLVLSQPLALAILALPWAWKRLSGEERLFAITSLGVALVAFFLKHPALSWRIMGMVSPFLALSGWMVLARAIQSYRRIPRWAPVAAAALWWVFLLIPHYRFQDWNAQPAAQARQAAGGDAMAWLRLNTPRGSKVAVGGNPGLYYLQGWDAQFLEGSHFWDERLLHKKTMSALVLGLRSEGFDWFLETAGDVPKGLYARYFAEHESRGGPLAAVSFAGSQGRIWDLKNLEESITHSDFVDFEPSPPKFRIPTQR